MAEKNAFRALVFLRSFVLAPLYTCELVFKPLCPEPFCLRPNVGVRKPNAVYKCGICYFFVHYINCKYLSTSLWAYLMDQDLMGTLF